MIFCCFNQYGILWIRSYPFYLSIPILIISPYISPITTGFRFAASPLRRFPGPCWSQPVSVDRGLWSLDDSQSPAPTSRGPRRLGDKTHPLQDLTGKTLDFTRILWDSTRKNEDFMRLKTLKARKIMVFEWVLTCFN
jgi:hypothetical protein